MFFYLSSIKFEIHFKNPIILRQLIILFFFCSSLSVFNLFGQSLSEDIRLNQLGFLPNSVKYAAVINTSAENFEVRTSDMQTVVLEGQFLPSAYYNSSEEEVILADFSLLNEPGEYVLVVDDLGKSIPFSVNENVFADLTKGMLKAYYFNRASIPILSEYGGQYARAAGHPDTEVVVLPSAASSNRPAGTVISTPGGWYDAGDYNKYIVSSGISVYTLLSAYETYPAYYDTLNTNIPESANNIPDILDEALYNIQWMMTMQDEDGGVYNKTTTANFVGFVMPNVAGGTRYVTAKGTAASLNLAAIMAMTSRIYRVYDADLADRALAMAIKAWDWAKLNPNVAFNNPGAQDGYPGVNTGGYGDADFEDEFFWAAAELYITTKDDSYYGEMDFNQAFGLPGWPVVSSLGLQSLVVHRESLTASADVESIKTTFINTISGAKNNISISPYRIPGDFYYWAGNNAFANWGMLFMQAFRLTGDAGYFNAGVATLDYLLGKNATTYSFVTGFGYKPPMNIHHRISSADGIVDPIPGWLAGGANPGNVNDDCGASSYPSLLPAKAYLDNTCSYSTNEIAIGINAPLLFLAGAVQSEYLANFLNTIPEYLSISTEQIALSYKIGDAVNVVIESNIDWELTTTADWISISQSSGSGTTIVQINAKGDNPTESERKAEIQVKSKDKVDYTIAVTQNGLRKSFRLEAEDYIEMSGIQVESSSDVGGGENIGYVDAGDYLIYNLDISVEGIYEVTFRHAGWESIMDLMLNDELLQQVNLPATADWQTWQSTKTEMILPEGQHSLKVIFKTDGTNLNYLYFNWLKFEPLASKQLSDNDITVFPNPSNGQLNIQLAGYTGAMDIELLSIAGKSILQKKDFITDKGYIDISSLQPGVYFLKTKCGSEVFTNKIILE